MSEITVKEKYTGEYRPIIERGGELSLMYRSREGRFNIMSDEVSIVCDVTVFENGKKLRSLSITVDYEYDGTDVDEVLWLFDEDRGMHWIDTSRNDKQALRDFISVHRERIEQGNAAKEIESLRKEIAQKSERLDYLTSIYTVAQEAN